ncbi:MULTISPECIES: NfeD family protein [Arthrobacter]|uniref:NfeD family protein n=2 Tax=Arthrobacter TaxID=1663 RepID=A0ABU9KJ70_9MICC|nr:NfeD family protein [Arthrobacter sp. YJM1]MDP5225960.1 NfeD family protein [Arthrobacter sp. YJM1]
MNWLIDNLWALWLVTLLVFAVIELLSLDFIFLMLSGASLIALLVALTGAPFWLQVVVFCVAALLMILFVRPLALRHLRKGPPDSLSNVDRLIGASVVVLEEVTARGGLVKIGGDVWSARTDGAPLSPGQSAQVQKIDGAHAVVGLSAPGTTSPDAAS